VLYGDIDKIIPAIKEPISIEKPAKIKREEITKHQQIENKNNNSWDFAIFFVKFGRIK